MWPKTQRQAELELGLLRRLVDEYPEMLERARSGEPSGTEVLALAAVLHSFYTGVENVLKRIAKDVDGALPGGERWHSDLLNQMSASTSERPAVISPDLRADLVEYLGFRHAFRHLYTYSVDWSRMRGLVTKLESVLARFDSELRLFLERGTTT